MFRRVPGRRLSQRWVWTWLVAKEGVDSDTVKMSGSEGWVRLGGWGQPPPASAARVVGWCYHWDGKTKEDWFGRSQVTCPSDDVTYAGVLELRGEVSTWVGGWSLSVCGRYLKPGERMRPQGGDSVQTRESVQAEAVESLHAAAGGLCLRLWASVWERASIIAFLTMSPGSHSCEIPLPLASHWPLERALQRRWDPDSRSRRSYSRTKQDF